MLCKAVANSPVFVQVVYLCRCCLCWFLPVSAIQGSMISHHSIMVLQPKHTHEDMHVADGVVVAAAEKSCHS